MPQRKAKIAMEYAGRLVQVGDTFHVEPNHVRTLLAIGRIEPEQGEKGYIEPVTAYATRDMNADAGSQYRTRQLRRKSAPQ